MIYIIRHGQTELNKRKIIQGRSDHPMNDAGIAQAKQAADKLRGVSFNTVYSSPLVRAIQTAKIIAPDAAPIIDERLVDMDYGPYEGTRIDELPSEAVAFFRDVRNPAPEGMEHIGSVMRRAGTFLEDRCRTGGNILIVTHAIVMKGLLDCLASGSSVSFWPRHIKNCAVFAAELLPDGAWSLPAEL